MASIRKNPDKLTKRALKVVAALQGGGTLCVKNGANVEGALANMHSFWIEPSGKSAAPTAVEELIAKGKIAPNSDGLFEGYAQTWRLAS